ncbi:spore germination protein 270-11-like [Saccostrea cucullata]|uniref:spore germination protein 270-11-like n=1 Tax=Saccostrea cuccullata TaxID=36930 RepID=UPI002ED1E1F4
MPKLIIKGANGIQLDIECDEATKQSLLSGDTDPQLKDMIVQMLIKQQRPEPQASLGLAKTLQQSTQGTPSATSSTGNSNPKSQLKASVPGSSSTSPLQPAAPPHSSASPSSSDESLNAGVHLWTDKQEDLLVHLRHDRQDLFEKNKNHVSLWTQISRDLSNAFKVKITPTQAINKYNNLKKRWKEIIDSGTGTERKYFRLKEDFDLMYGTRQSTKPAFTIDSSSSDSIECPTPSHAETVTKSKSPKKKELLEQLDAKEEEFNDKIEKFHAEKMKRMDRFLDLFEKSIEKNEK